MGVWIEICGYICGYWNCRQSLPLWECGLKFRDDWEIVEGEVVTPFVGVWIEIRKHMSYSSKLLITPFVGVWIEITQSLADMSLNLVTPFVGVRI